MIEWAQAIEASGPARWLALSTVVYPLISAGHVLALAFVVAPILAADAAILGLAPAARPWVPALARVALAAFPLAAATGAALFVARATDYAANPAFLAKLALIGLAGLNALAYRRLAPAQAPGAGPAALAAVSAALWLGALLAGRWIAFV